MTLLWVTESKAAVFPSPLPMATTSFKQQNLEIYQGAGSL